MIAADTPLPLTSSFPTCACDTAPGDDHSRFADEIKDVLGSLQFSSDNQLVGPPVPSNTSNPFLANKE